MTLKELIAKKRPIPVSMLSNQNLDGVGDKGYLIGGVLHLSPGVYHLIQVSESKRLKLIMDKLEVIEVPDFSKLEWKPRIKKYSAGETHDKSNSTEREGRTKEG